MRIVVVQEGDNLLDLSLRYYGSIEQVHELANDNNLSITDDIPAGQKLIIYPEKVLNPLMVIFFNNGTKG